jgi:hypothetical protein
MICFVLHDPLTQEAGVKRFTGDVDRAAGGGAKEAAADMFAGVAGDAAQVGSARPRRPDQQRPWQLADVRPTLVIRSDPSTK